MRVNGVERDVDVELDMPFFLVFCDVLGLIGTKYGCGQALCGACTIHVDGSAVRACVMPVRSAVGKDIVTIEGLSPDGSHPLQKAWTELAVPQCGFCQAGQIMSAAALLSKTPKPTDAEIDQSLSGNLCRCGTYPRIRAAIQKVTKA